MSTTAAETSDASPIQRRWGAPRCGYYSNVVMLWIGVRIPWIGYVFVWLAALYFYFCVPSARRASLRYLDMLHAPKHRSFLRRQWQTYRHLVEFGILMLDRAVILSRPDHGFFIDCQDLIHFTDSTRKATAAAEPTGIILLTAHFGMAEIAAPCLRKMGFRQPLSIVMYQNPHDATERFHTTHRRMIADIPVISTTDPLSAGIKIIAALRKGEIVALRADRTMDGKGTSVQLLGRAVKLPSGPFLAATLSGAPVVYIHACRVGYRHYRCIFAAPQFSANPADSRDQQTFHAAQDFADNLESMIRRHPNQWSNFYDFWQIQHPA